MAWLAPVAGFLTSPAGQQMASGVLGGLGTLFQSGINSLVGNVDSQMKNSQDQRIRDFANQYGSAALRSAGDSVGGYVQRTLGNFNTERPQPMGDINYGTVNTPYQRSTDEGEMYGPQPRPMDYGQNFNTQPQQQQSFYQSRQESFMPYQPRFQGQQQFNTSTQSRVNSMRTYMQQPSQAQMDYQPRQMAVQRETFSQPYKRMQFGNARNMFSNYQPPQQRNFNFEKQNDNFMQPNNMDELD